MRIEDLRSETRQNHARVAATVIWEDCDRPTQDVYFETEDAFSDDLWCNPHAFVVACLVPAMRFGEHRIAIREPVGPELRNGLKTAMAWLCHWYGLPRRPLRIEADPGIGRTLPPRRRRVGSFLSGGIDSLALLRANRLSFPLDHPRSIRDCLLVHGFDIGVCQARDPDLQVFERARSSLVPVADDAAVSLIPVFTNVRHLCDDVAFWMYEFHGAALASVAHAFDGRLSHVAIASSDPIPHLVPWGSHPLLDPNYSSAELDVRHEGIRLTRLEKVAMVAEWGVALQNVRVCTAGPAVGLNCGLCEKCVRTMTELVAIGRLADTHAFPTSDVSAELLHTVQVTASVLAEYRELIAPLKTLRRDDLAAVIEAKCNELERHIAWEEERDWKGAVKRFDRKWLGGNLFRVYAAMRARIRRRDLSHG